MTKTDNSQTKSPHPLRIFWISALLTIALAVVVGIFDSLAAVWIFTILVLLEVTFSFDNAVVNSRILAKMSPLWQKLFLTVGIFIAVFVVRFALPIVIVMIAAGLDFMHVIRLAIEQPAQYGATLHEAAPLISAFGGAFLLMIGLNYFLDRNKDIHWLTPIERALSSVGDYKKTKMLVLLIIGAILYMTVEQDSRTAVLVASVLGVLLHSGLELMGKIFEKNQKSSVTHQVGWAAFASFMYLEVLDASFSFDGVIGAFAITSSVLLIVAGLGAGALWVRSLTVYLMKAGTLNKYRYLEHGAHWAILALGVVMIMKLYHIELPEWLTGSLGLIFILTAVASSILEKRMEQRRTGVKVS
jgi:hypothetical protein